MIAATDVALGALDTRYDFPNRCSGLCWHRAAAIRTFDFDGDVEITANRGDESITLDYDDHSDIATISVDRNDVPVGGQVHITISDFQLNLDPTADDAWTLNATGSATYNNVLLTLLMAKTSHPLLPFDTALAECLRLAGKTRT